MASLQELFQGFQMLQDNVKGLAIDKAMKDANDQVYSIRNSMAKDEEKVAALRNVASDFTLRLTGMGARPDQISAASQAIAPPIENLKTPQDAALMGPLMGYPSLGAKGQEMMNQEHQWKMDQINAMSGIKQQKEFGKNYDSALKDFRDKAAKKDLDMLQAGREVSDLINKPNPNFAEMTEAQIATIRAVTNRVTNTEFLKAIPNQGAADYAYREYMRWMQDKTYQPDVKALQSIGQAFQYHASQRIIQNAYNFAGNRASRVNMDPSDFAQRLIKEHLYDQPGYAPNVPQQPAGAAPIAAPGSTAPALPTGASGGFKLW